MYVILFDLSFFCSARPSCIKACVVRTSLQSFSPKLVLYLEQSKPPSLSLSLEEDVNQYNYLTQLRLLPHI